MSYKFYSHKTVDEQNDDQWAERSVKGEIESRHTRTLMDIFNRFIKNDNKLKIMEAGCGLGSWVDFFWKNGHDVIGIEYEQEVVDRVKEYDKDFPIVRGDVTNLKEYKDNSYDHYISLGVIEHFEEGPQKALQEAYRVLKPGGLAHITVPYHSWSRKLVAHRLRDLFFFIRWLKGKQKYYWEYRYSKKELRRFLEEAGFEVIYTGFDDYIQSDKRRHIGIYADYFFLRQRGGEVWELNAVGQKMLALAKLFSPWLIISGVFMIGRKK